MVNSTTVREKKFEQLLSESGEVGYVVRTEQCVAEIEGLPGVKISEMVIFETGQLGEVTALKEGSVEVLLLSREGLVMGTRAVRTGSGLVVSVGTHMLGHTIDVAGAIVSGKAKTSDDAREMKIDVMPRGIVGRKKIGRQLNTGVMMIDLMIPLGLGQRELVMGDRKTGKSYILWQLLINQVKMGGIAIYAAIGKKKTEIARTEEFFRSLGVLENMIIVAASSMDSVGQVYLCPYTAMAAAEYFRDAGRDVLLILDDMSTHAKFYRELSLISRKFPGRDSYPGDIFHIHSKLLERGGDYVVKKPDGTETEAAITVIPVVETVQGDVTGYIQTNLMSMTDGHIYFDLDLFFKGRRPSINPFISVTRVGHQTQSELGRDASRTLYDLFNSYERTGQFLRFGAELGENSRQILAMGDKILAFFDQRGYSVVPINVTYLGVALLLSGMWDGMNLEKLVSAYGSQEQVRRSVDDVVSKATTLTQLLDVVRRDPQPFLQQMK